MKLSQNIIDSIIAVLGPQKVLLDEPMKLHTTMQVGGPADLFICPSKEDEIVKVIALLKSEEIPYYILGNGSNIICRDQGFTGAIICLGKNYRGYEISQRVEEHAYVRVKAGTDNADFAADMISEGLRGFEFASGIPGSIGGATAMNAGAYDGEIRQIVREVKLLDEHGDKVILSNKEMDFGYRHSVVSDGSYVVLETVFDLERDDPDAICARVEELSNRRKEKQPLEMPSCGSTFKRPSGYFAGKLISDAGLKGMRLGGAQVSEKHAGFIINRDNASAKDVIDLIELVKKRVFESQGVQLECEVKII